nr:hypothetical protein [Rhodococcus wratislaviensis]GLK38664.1 hypothetical protein GCM10017611_55310 [Rhodococcus wratislaviensis]
MNTTPHEVFSAVAYRKLWTVAQMAIAAMEPEQRAQLEPRGMIDLMTYESDDEGYLVMFNDTILAVVDRQWLRDDSDLEVPEPVNDYQLPESMPDTISDMFPDD